MATAWVPAPNPAGQNRRRIRRILFDWLTAAQVAGLDIIYPGEATEVKFDDIRRNNSGFACAVAIMVNDDSEERAAYTGPGDPGGKMVHWSVTLDIYHRTYERDRELIGEDHRDNVVDALKDALRGIGRDLGRPEIVLGAGEEPREGGITTEYERLVVDGDVVTRNAAIHFTVTQYLLPAVEATP